MTRKQRHTQEAGAALTSRLVRNHNFRDITGNWRHPTYVAYQLRQSLGVGPAIAAAVASALARRG